MNMRDYPTLHFDTNESKDPFYKLFLNYNLSISDMLDSLSCSFTFISFLTTSYFLALICVLMRLLINANSGIFSAISWREQVNFQLDDDEVRFVLYQHA
jgi:hypothetical protein